MMLRPMATWGELEAADPELAAAGRDLLWVPGVGFGYLATVRRDGGPRIHPINVVIVDGRLLAFLVPSPKLDDLRRDGRWALHTTGSETVNDELSLAGRATMAAGDADLRARAVAACGFEVGADHTLVELGIESALWAHYATPPRWPPEYRRWRSAGS